MNKSISIPVEVLCKSKGPNKQDSFFYAGNNIARVRILNREYVLTTSGMYDFAFISGRKRRDFKIASDDIRRFRTLANRLTDARIKKLTDNGALVSNWGWFGINVWEDDKCLADTATVCYGEYDEAMTAFITFIQKDLSLI